MHNWKEKARRPLISQDPRVHIEVLIPDWMGGYDGCCPSGTPAAMCGAEVHPKLSIKIEEVTCLACLKLKHKKNLAKAKTTRERIKAVKEKYGNRLEVSLED